MGNANGRVISYAQWWCSLGLFQWLPNSDLLPFQWTAFSSSNDEPSLFHWSPLLFPSRPFDPFSSASTTLPSVIHGPSSGSPYAFSIGASLPFHSTFQVSPYPMTLSVLPLSLSVLFSGAPSAPSVVPLNPSNSALWLCAMTSLGTASYLTCQLTPRGK